MMAALTTATDIMSGDRKTDHQRGTVMARRKIGPDEPQWGDLWCRRAALGVTTIRLADLVGMSQTNISAAENGRRPVAQKVWPVIERLEQCVTEVEEHAYKQGMRRAVTATATTPIVLHAYVTDDQLAAADTRWSDIPVEVHRVGIGRAAAALIATGRTVRIHMPTDDAAK